MYILLITWYSLPSLKETIGPDVYWQTQPRNPLQSVELRAPEHTSRQNSSAVHTAQHQARGRPPVSHSTNTNSTLQYAMYASSTESASRAGSVSTASESTWAYSTASSPVTPYVTPSSSDADGQRKGHKGRKIRKQRSSKNDAKNGKEKRQRAELSGIFQLHQDILELYCGSLHGTGQSAGNAKTSGLGIRKLDIAHQFIAVLLPFFDEAFKEALETGRVEEFHAKCKQLSEKQDPTFDTLMYGTGHHCRRGENQTCATHGLINWIQCRITRVKENFKRNVASFLEECKRRRA